MLSEPIQVVGRLAQAFDGLDVAYLVGGSLASSVYGIPRATQDVDLVAAIELSHVAPFVRELGDEFYVDAERVRDAIRRRASFNVLHLPTLFKADVFIAKQDDWSREELTRGREERLEGPDGPVLLRFASPEDTLLHKLVWYRLGNEVSERQWRDALGLVEVQGDGLDREYLERWAERLGVADLLHRTGLSR